MKSEIDERATYGAEGEDFPWQVNLFDEARVRQDGHGCAVHNVAEQHPCCETDENENGEVGGSAGGTQNLADGEVVNEELNQRPEEAPQNSQGAVFVPSLDFSLDKAKKEFAMGPHIGPG